MYAHSSMSKYTAIIFHPFVCACVVHHRWVTGLSHPVTISPVDAVKPGAASALTQGSVHTQKHKIMILE